MSQSYKCPSCGAELDISNGEIAFCPYCGSKISVGFSEEDKANQEKLENERMKRQIELKKLEMEEKRREEEKRVKRVKLKAYIGLIVAGVLIMIIFIGIGSASGNEDSGFYAIGAIGFPMIMAGIGLLATINDDQKQEK